MFDVGSNRKLELVQEFEIGVREVGGNQGSRRGECFKAGRVSRVKCLGVKREEVVQRLQDLVIRRAVMILLEIVLVERCGQKLDCRELLGEAIFELGYEWQVRNWSVSCGLFGGGEEKSEGSGWRRKESQRRVFFRMEVVLVGVRVATEREC